MQRDKIKHKDVKGALKHISSLNLCGYDYYFKQGFVYVTSKPMTDKQKKAKERMLFFLSQWDKAQVNGVVHCFECGRPIHRSYRLSSTCYSHILGRKQFPQYELHEKNVVVVHPDCHLKYETNKEKAPMQNNLRKKLLELHESLSL